MMRLPNLCDRQAVADEHLRHRYYVPREVAAFGCGRKILMKRLDPTISVLRVFGVLGLI